MRANRLERPKVESMLVASSCANVAPYGIPRRKTAEPRQAAVLPSPDGRACFHERYRDRTDTQADRLLDQPMVEQTNHDVEVHPADGVKRHIMTWDGMAAEIVQ